MFKILQTLRCTVHFIFLPKFPTFVLFTLILSIACHYTPTPCCHAVMTSKIPLICRSPLRVSLGTCTILWEMNNRFLYSHIIIFPSEGSITDSMALYQYKKISLCRKNNSIVLQVLQKILSLLTSGQEKKVCRYQSTASSQLRLNPSSAIVGKTPHNTRPQSGQTTDCLQEDKNWEPQHCFQI